MEGVPRLHAARRETAASLREDYLNQVQRDFLSRADETGTTPLADAADRQTRPLRGEL